MLANRMQLDWKAATVFMATDPEWKRKVFVGGLLLMIPVLGWPVVLGYRKTVVKRLVDGALPVLPQWRGQFWHYFLEGMKALFVIYVYLSPVILWFAIRMYGSPAAEHIPWLYLGCFLFAFSMFSPVAVPWIVAYFAWFSSETFVSPGEGAAMVCLFTFITFMIPAGFLQVSRHRRISAAFNVVAMVRLLKKSFTRYCEAWIGCGTLSFMAHFAIPFSPWTVVWCYMAIVYAFNEVPLDSETKRETGYLANSWIARINDGYLDNYDQQGRRLTYKVANSGSNSRLSVAQGFKTLRFAYFEIPIG